MTDDRWSDLRSIWHDDPSAGDAARVIAQVRRAERARSAARLTRIAVVVASLGALLGAVAHAVTPLEAVLALTTAGTIAAYWAAAAAIERRQRDLLGAESHSYVTARRDWLRTELQVLHFVWIVVAMELAFLIPWWAAGIPIHFGGFMTTAALGAWWLPLTGIAVFAAWSVSRYQARRREWRALEEHLQSGNGQSGNGESGNGNP